MMLTKKVIWRLNEKGNNGESGSDDGESENCLREGNKQPARGPQPILNSHTYVSEIKIFLEDLQNLCSLSFQD